MMRAASLSSMVAAGWLCAAQAYAQVGTHSFVAEGAEGNDCTDGDGDSGAPEPAANTYRGATKFMTSSGPVFLCNEEVTVDGVTRGVATFDLSTRAGALIASALGCATGTFTTSFNVTSVPDDPTANELTSGSPVYDCDVSLPGDPGAVGVAGLNVLSRTEEIDPGAECATGGLRVVAGMDEDDDGVLDESEARTTQRLCTGANSVQPVFRFTPIAKGGSCGDNSGLLIGTGFDDGVGSDIEGAGGNGILDKGEEDTLATTCFEDADVFPDASDDGCSVAKRTGGNLFGQTALWLIAIGVVVGLRRRRTAR
jgi:hypothetical protein